MVSFSIITGTENHPTLPASVKVVAFLLEPLGVKKYKMHPLFLKNNSSVPFLQSNVKRVNASRVPACGYAEGSEAGKAMGYWYDSTYDVEQGMVIRVLIEAKNTKMTSTSIQTNKFANRVITSLFLKISKDAPMYEITIPNTRIDGRIIDESKIRGRFDIVDYDTVISRGYDTVVSRNTRAYLDGSFNDRVLRVRKIQEATDAAPIATKSIIVDSEGNKKEVTVKRKKRRIQ